MAFITSECVSAATEGTSDGVCVRIVKVHCNYPKTVRTFSSSHTVSPIFRRAKTHTQRTHTLLASSFLFNQGQTAHPEEEPHRRNFKRKRKKHDENISKEILQISQRLESQ